MPVGACYEWDGFWPGGTGKKLIWLPKSTIVKHLHDTGNRNAFGDAVYVPDVTMKPTAVFEGLCRAGQEEALCFCGVPSLEFARLHAVPCDEIKAGMTFMAFLTVDMEVTKFRFCECEPEQSGFPINHGTRFGRRLWPV